MHIIFLPSPANQVNCLPLRTRQTPLSHHKTDGFLNKQKESGKGKNTITLKKALLKREE